MDDRLRDRGGGSVEISALAFGALRELGNEEDGNIINGGDGLWILDGSVTPPSG